MACCSYRPPSYFPSQILTILRRSPSDAPHPLPLILRRTLRRTTFGGPEERLCWFKAIIPGCKRFYMKKKGAKAEDRRAYNYRFALSWNPLKPSLTIAACQSRLLSPTQKWFANVRARTSRYEVVVTARASVTLNYLCHQPPYAR